MQKDVEEIEYWERDILDKHRDGTLYIGLRNTKEFLEKVKRKGKGYGEIKVDKVKGKSGR